MSPLCKLAGSLSQRNFRLSNLSVSLKDHIAFWQLEPSHVPVPPPWLSNFLVLYIRESDPLAANTESEV